MRAFVLLVAVPMLLAGCVAQAGSSASPGTASGSTRTPRSTAPRVEPITADARARLAAMNLKQKVASLLMLHQPGTNPAALRAFIDAYGLGGLILMGDNVPASVPAMAAMTKSLAADPALPPLLGIDEEGGIVARMPDDRAPAANLLKSMPAAATRAAFTTRSTLLRSAGVNVNFGIIADVTADQHSFIYDRVLGTDPAASSDRVAAAVAGEHGRVVSTLKHFPGHGAAPGDSHTSIPSAPLGHASWLAQDAPPFRAGIRAGAEMVMFGHLAYPAIDPLPASLSPAWHRILRGELGFHGVSITDDMLMLQHTGLARYSNPSENAIAALAAGNTMLLYVLPGDPAAAGVNVTTLIANISAAVTSGRIPQAVIDADVLKLLELRRTISGR